MTDLFISLFNMSITASWLVLAVIVLRFLLKKAPKWINAVLWAFVGFRLICPFSFESIFSLIPSTDTVPHDIIYSPSPSIHSGIPALNSTVNPIISETFAPDVTASVNPLQIVLFVTVIVWIIGIAAMLIYSGVSFIRLNNKVREGVVLKDNIWLCDRIDTPFILGLVRPRIFLPSGMSESDMEYVIAHENAHLRRRDHWWKPLGFLLLTVYWFNPVMWLAYILLCRDIELACDEKVIKEMGTDIKKSYSEALINCSVSRRTISACPLAFGETGVKDRIKSVLSYKKPALWIIIIAVISCIVVGVCFLTNPVGSNGIVERIVNENGYTITNQEKIEVTLSIPKSSLPENIYSEEGYEFANDEVIAYKDDVTTIFLKQVRFSNEGNNNLYFCFDFSYDAPKDGGKLLSPLGVGEKSSFVLSNSFVLSKKDKTMRDQNTLYEDAVQVIGQGDNNLIWFYVSTDALRQAEGTISFDIYLNRITYLKDRATASELKDRNPELDAAVSQAILDINSSRDLYNTECLAEGHTIYGIEEEGDNVTVYLLEEFAGFGFKNGYFMGQTGHRTPAVYAFAKIDDAYILTDYEYALPGESYADSIREMFPKEYHSRILDYNKKDNANLWPQCVAYAEAYLKKIGREAEVCHYSEVPHTMLTDVGVSVEVSNKLVENNSLNHYDSDIGNYETLEDGVRFVYRTDYDKTRGVIIFTTEVYKTGDILEKIEVDGQTGKILLKENNDVMLPEPEIYPENKNDYAEKLDYTVAAKIVKEMSDKYSITAIHCPASGEVESGILMGEAYCNEVAAFLNSVNWKRSLPPIESLSSPGSVEFVIDEDYRVTVYERKKGSLFAYAVVKYGDEERYYHASYDDYKDAVAILHPPAEISGSSIAYPVNSYSYLTEYDSAYISLTPVTKQAHFSLSLLSSYICIGRYTEDENEIVITARDMEHQYTFRKNGNNLIFVADKSTKMPEYKYETDMEPVPCVPDGAVFESHGLESGYIDKTYTDIDNDGIKEDCILGYGPTSGLYTFTFTVYENGYPEYFNIFNSEATDIQFGASKDGKVIVRGQVHSDYDYKVYAEYEINIKDGNIVLGSGDSMMPYWGEQGLDSPYAPK